MQYYLVPSSELYHHGVVGMRWGHRKAKPTNSVIKPIHQMGAYSTYQSMRKTHNKLSMAVYDNDLKNIAKHTKKMNKLKKSFETRYSDITKEDLFKGEQYVNALSTVLRTTSMALMARYAGWWYGPYKAARTAITIGAAIKKANDSRYIDSQNNKKEAV